MIKNSFPLCKFGLGGPLRKYLRGLTLIELMVTLSIAAVLVSLAVPSFQSMVASSNLSTATNDLLISLEQARSNAIRIGSRVTVCKSANGANCATAGNWEQGWIVFNDGTRTTSDATVDTGETILSVTSALNGTLVVKGNVTLEQYVSFASDGQSKTMNGAFLAGKIRVCSTAAGIGDEKRARDLTLNSVGRIVLSYPTGVAATCPAPT